MRYHCMPWTKLYMMRGYTDNNWWSLLKALDCVMQRSAWNAVMQ